MKKWQIWSEGIGAMTGTEGRTTPAHFHGVGSGVTFKDACDNYFKENPSIAYHRQDGTLVYKDYYDPERLTYWGCKLYDNEEDARKEYG